MSNFANPELDTFARRLILPSGTPAAPSVVFANDLTEGLYWTTDGLVLSGLATPVNPGDAANKAYVDSATAGSFPLLAPNGTVGAPSYSFTSSPGTGFFYPASDAIGVSSNGTEICRFTGNRISMQAGGTESTPSISIANATTGFFDSAPTAVGITTNGTFIAEFDGSGLHVNNILPRDAGAVTLTVSGDTSFEIDANDTAGETRMLLWDVDNATLVRVSVGGADSGGTGFKVLRIPN